MRYFNLENNSKEINDMCQMVKNGTSFTDAGLKYGKDATSVKYWCRVMGVDYKKVKRDKGKTYRDYVELEAKKSKTDFIYKKYLKGKYLTGEN